MKNPITRLMVPLGLALLAAPLLSLAPHAAHADEVTCESKDERQTECDMDTRGNVWMVRQLSKTRCVEGVNWGLYKHSVWVKDGCRAVFASDGGGGGGSGYDNRSTYNPASGGSGEIRCESKDGKLQRCPMNTRGGVHIVRQLSDTTCRQGTNWGSDPQGVWVNSGCRAIFASGGGGDGSNYTAAPAFGTGPSQVTCESKDGGRADCTMNTSGNVRLVRQLSKTRCVEGENWGLFKHSVWVSNGCRAVFASDGGSGGSHAADGPPPKAIQGCNAVQDRYGQVVSHSALKPGHWEIILQYDDGQYVCNVNNGGHVSYFEKLRR
jgi:hypothetical protein